MAVLVIVLFLCILTSLCPPIGKLTNFMEHSSSWEANTSAATQEIPCTLWNPEVHYRIYKSPSCVPAWNISIQSIPFHPTSRRSILILSSYLRLGVPGGSVPQVSLEYPRNILVLIFRGWVDPRAHGSVGSYGKNPQRHHWGSIPRPSDYKRSILTTTLPQALEYTGTWFYLTPLIATSLVPFRVMVGRAALAAIPICPCILIHCIAVII
jgi:hypothetical protein